MQVLGLYFFYLSCSGHPCDVVVVGPAVIFWGMGKRVFCQII